MCATSHSYDGNDDMECEGQSTAFECMEDMLQTFLERVSNLEEDADSAMLIELSSLKQEMVEEEISRSNDEPKYLYDHNKIVELKKRKNLKKKSLVLKRRS
ncbi:hypothetical protein HAX54_010674 [Datura stramonium]|uniref:Uncharacterized protein n=1 Tax=Datura stramonium TaxID=4076 RepID=A0ABS8TGM7_DATST|nr:hypothetical protein [Datura stramonium]